MAAEDLTDAEKEKKLKEKMKKCLEIQVREEGDERVKAYKDQVQLHMPGWKLRFYKSKFKVSDEQLDQFIAEIKKSYIEGLQWVFSYYYNGCPSWEWFYPYHYAPFVSDLADLGKIKIVMEKSTPSLPFEQLMSVFPQQSAHAIPPVYRPLMCDPHSPITDFYPLDWEFDINGKPYAWMGVHLLPFIEMSRLLEAMKPINAKLSPEEQLRNRHGKSFLIFGNTGDRISNFFNEQTPEDLREFEASFHKCKQVSGKTVGRL
jgi:5'-3' exoribonuclease 2